jgi:hypothetical protein
VDQLAARRSAAATRGALSIPSGKSGCGFWRYLQLSPKLVARHGERAGRSALLAWKGN